MLFNSYIFWVFFAGVIILYRVLPHKLQNRMLLVAGYVFYGSWDWRFLSLLLITTVVDYVVALRIAACQLPQGPRPAAKKAWLIFSLCVNLGLLGFFKYYGFFARECVDLFERFGLTLSLPTLRVILPVGISFYTFQSIGYVVDVYRGAAVPARSFLDYALYVAFFPQLVAGPIERFNHMMPQIVAPRVSKPGDFAEGLYHVLVGLFKKVVIADNMAFVVNGIFGSEPSKLSGLDCLMGVYAFAFQVYGDFSGYSSIAQGIAKWLGFDLMTNFRMPYFAQTPGDFWRRWHISLSTWLRDYLYIPLGGNRHGTWQTYRNLMLTMFLGGLWHGANWTFVAWGVLHGALLCAYRPFERRLRPAEPSARPRAWRSIIAAFIMFHFVCAGWLLFRADTIGQAWGMFSQMFTDLRVTPLTTYALATIAFFVGPAMLFECWIERSQDILHLTRAALLLRAGAYSYIALMMLVFHPTLNYEFIYFQF